jgi:hypothetical protein
MSSSWLLPCNSLFGWQTIMRFANVYHHAMWQGGTLGIRVACLGLQSLHQGLLHPKAPHKASPTPPLPVLCQVQTAGVHVMVARVAGMPTCCLHPLIGAQLAVLQAHLLHPHPRSVDPQLCDDRMLRRCGCMMCAVEREQLPTHRGLPLRYGTAGEIGLWMAGGAL